MVNGHAENISLGPFLTLVHTSADCIIDILLVRLYKNNSVTFRIYKELGIGYVQNRVYL